MALSDTCANYFGAPLYGTVLKKRWHRFGTVLAPFLNLKTKTVPNSASALGTVWQKECQTVPTPPPPPVGGWGGWHLLALCPGAHHGIPKTERKRRMKTEIETPSSVVEKESLRERAWEQLAAYRAECIRLLQRLGQGTAVWRDKGKEWEEPDWAASPEQWPVVAKVLYLWARIDRLQYCAYMAQSFSDSPAWCSQCGEVCPNGHSETVCLEHYDWPLAVKQLARTLFQEVKP